MEKEFNPFDNISGEALRTKMASLEGQVAMGGKLSDCVEQLLREEGILRQVLDIKPAVETELQRDLMTHEKYAIIPVCGRIGNYIGTNFKNVPTTLAVS